MGTTRRRVAGNLIWPRLEQILREDGWGARERLLARLHLIAGEYPEFAALGTMRANAISELRHYVCPDVLLFAVADALNVSAYWLAGLTDDRSPPPGIRRLLNPDNAKGE
jgi:hypothetical protein